MCTVEVTTELWELEFQVVVSCHLDVLGEKQVLLTLSHSSSPRAKFLNIWAFFGEEFLYYEGFWWNTYKSETQISGLFLKSSRSSRAGPLTSQCLATSLYSNRNITREINVVGMPDLGFLMVFTLKFVSESTQTCNHRTRK